MLSSPATVVSGRFSKSRFVGAQVVILRVESVTEESITVSRSNATFDKFNDMADELRA